MSYDPNEPAIRVSNLKKDFMLPHQKKSSIKQVFVSLGRGGRKSKQHVLRGIDFEIKHGEFFGIVGRNGSGKSTLLKILAGVYRPTSGKIDINGELTPFIELGVGFNPELSGRDNIYLNGALLGFSEAEMEAMFDDIVAFAELEEFIDQKLKNYSSGMQVRLAFAIATKAHNDILIFDEVLAVGDEAFQRKCLDVFEEYKARKQTVILVTHDMETVKQFCNRAMLISDGIVKDIGDPQRIARLYSSLNQEVLDNASTKDVEKREKIINLTAKIYDESYAPRKSFAVGERMVVRTAWNQNDFLDSIVVNIYKKSGEHVTGFKTKTDGHTLKRDDTAVDAAISLDVCPGKYYLLVQSLRANDEEIDVILKGPEFTIKKQDNMRWAGIVNLDHRWLR